MQQKQNERKRNLKRRSSIIQFSKVKMRNLVISNAGHALKTPTTVSKVLILTNLEVKGFTKSILDCVQNGHWEYCANGQKACFIEERKRRDRRGKERKVTSVHSGCKQLNACQVLFQVTKPLPHYYCNITLS